jgi:hypothetical protein
VRFAWEDGEGDAGIKHLEAQITDIVVELVTTPRSSTISTIRTPASVTLSGSRRGDRSPESIWRRRGGRLKSPHALKPSPPPRRGSTTCSVWRRTIGKLVPYACLLAPCDDSRSAEGTRIDFEDWCHWAIAQAIRQKNLAKFSIGSKHEKWR